MANAMPQTPAPALGRALLAVSSANNRNYDLLFRVASVVGALVVLPLKKVR